jgi:hypothetical protein
MDERRGRREGEEGPSETFEPEPPSILLRHCLYCIVPCIYLYDHFVRLVCVSFIIQQSKSHPCRSPFAHFLIFELTATA